MIPGYLHTPAAPFQQHMQDSGKDAESLPPRVLMLRGPQARCACHVNMYYTISLLSGFSLIKALTLYEVVVT